jgi:hypothetical protein
VSTETAAVVLAIVAGVLVVGLLVALRALTKAAAALAAAAEQLQREAVPLVIDLRTKVAETTGTVERMGLLIEAAESMTATADSASRLAVAALGNPVVKSVAFGAGVARGFRRLTGRDEPSRENGRGPG